MNQQQQKKLQVLPCRIADCDEWDSYIRSKPDASVFHTSAWNESVRKAYGHEPRHLAGWSQGQLVGILPQFEIKSVFVGKVFVSIPYATYGGIVADNPGSIPKSIPTITAKNIIRMFSTVTN